MEHVEHVEQSEYQRFECSKPFINCSICSING